MLVVKANHAATGTDTINIDSLGAKTLNRTGAIATDTIFAFVYDSVADDFNVVAPLATDLSTDTTPQLGGNLDGQGNEINSISGLFIDEAAALQAQ